ncbi:MAG: hypothetical protein Fur0041_11510 [Bacteroidia bacterium]
MKKWTHHDIEAFRALILQCDEKSISDKLDFLIQHEASNLKAFMAFHDALLMLCAYPPSENVYYKAEEQLWNFESTLIKFLRRKQIGKEQTVNTGLAGTRVDGAFSLELLYQLGKHCPENIILHSFDPEGKSVYEALRYVLPAAEFDVLTGDEKNQRVLELLFGDKKGLNRLVKLIYESGQPFAFRDYLFEQLKAYASVQLKGMIQGRTGSRAPVSSLFIHESIEKKCDHASIIDQPLPQETRLSKEQKEKLFLHSRIMLLTLNRETDPVTYGDADGLKYFELDRGFSVALFSMRPERRLAFDSYIGFMMYKNGLPVAYGGAWMFIQRAMFGINIFEPYRGGESAMVFAQLLRTYHQLFDVRQFSVEPYQFGRGNPEGIASGAYWFYYRFGFRSDDAKISTIAEKEMKKIASKKGYRTPPEILLKFTESNITLLLHGHERSTAPDAGALSKLLSEKILIQYSGDRSAALLDVRNKAESILGESLNKLISKNDLNFCNDYLLWLLVMERPEKITEKELRTWIHLASLKCSGDEYAYIAELNKWSRGWEVK